ncbi:HDOD domain-containing protein [Marinomonas agarivorans]|nr:HDOD domain-containing protein [Marinomonas agarivorans]
MDNKFNIDTTVALARQPILNAQQSIWAYELFYRASSHAIDAEIYDGSSATAQVISTSLLEIGIDNLIGNKKAFINFPRHYLLDPANVPITKDQVIVEVLNNSEFDPVLLEALQKWQDLGYEISLDNFSFNTKLTPFLALADYVKLDLVELGYEKLMEQVEILRDFEVKIIVEKIEAWDEFDFCRKLDVDYFQGYFFSQPQTISRKAVRVNNMTLLQVMGKLLNLDDFSVKELDDIISQDVGLVHKLLKYLNSPVTGLVATVDTVQLAIVLIGAQQLKSLTNLLLMSEMVGDRESLLKEVLIRSKHAELFAVRMGYANTDKYFLAGMLSMIDVCMGLDLIEVLEALPLPTELANAILNRSGKIGATLNQVEQYAKGGLIADEDTIIALKESYIEAVIWSDQLCSAI